MLFTNRNDIRRTSGSFLGWLKAVGRMLMYAMRVISVLIRVYFVSEYSADGKCTESANND